MGRRKKEPAEVHRSKIASSAEKLFKAKGIEGTTMDEVAAEAGYSKATLYVYFKNKQDIVYALTLKGMTMLHTRICAAIASCTGTQAQYMALCTGLVRYQEQFPFYFMILQTKITTDFENCTDIERKIFEEGEQINKEMASLFEKGIRNGNLRSDLDIMPTVFLFWASLTGIIQMSAEKKEYIAKVMKMTRSAFLKESFALLYHSISQERPNEKSKEQ